MSQIKYPSPLWGDLNFPIIMRSTGSTIATYTATGAAPAANPWVHMLQAHIQLDTLGSTQLTSK